MDGMTEHLMNEPYYTVLEQIEQLKIRVLRLEAEFYKKNSDRYKVCRHRGVEFPDTHALYDEEVDEYCDRALNEARDDNE